MIVVAYLYWPVIYLAVFLPFIVPRLPRWDHLPLALAAALIGGYVALLLAAGRGRDHGRIALHALGIAVGVDAFTLLVAGVRRPSQTLAAAFDPWEVLVTGAHAVVAWICLEGGRALGRLANTRRSAA